MIKTQGKKALLQNNFAPARSSSENFIKKIKWSLGFVKKRTLKANFKLKRCSKFILCVQINAFHL